MIKRLKITRTVVSIDTVPFNSDYYPDMTIEEAIAEETDPARDDWKEYFFERAMNPITTIEVQVIDE